MQRVEAAVRLMRLRAQLISSKIHFWTSRHITYQRHSIGADCDHHRLSDGERARGQMQQRGHPSELATATAEVVGRIGDGCWMYCCSLRKNCG